MQWLNKDLKRKVRAVFEPEYKRKLTDREVETIATNLTEFFEIYIKFKLNQNNASHQT